MRQIDTSVKRRYRIIWKGGRDVKEMTDLLFGMVGLLSGYDFWEFEECFVETSLDGVKRISESVVDWTDEKGKRWRSVRALMKNEKVTFAGGGPETGCSGEK